MEFNTYKEALKYYQENKNSVPHGSVMGISSDGKIVNVSPINHGVEIERTKRPRNGTFTGFGSDNLPGGINGIINHADGKRYDSKSQYERAVKARGCRIVGNDYNDRKFDRQLEGNFSPRNELKQAVHKVLGS